MIQIKYTRSGVTGIKRRELQEVGRAAIYASALHWWRYFLPIHFTRRAYQRYGYKPRGGDVGSGRRFKGSYAERKIKKRKNGQGVQAIGENKPLVWSGRSREAVTGTQNIRAVARNFKDYEARVVMNAPTLNFVKNSRNELTGTVVDEELEMQAAFESEFEAELNKRGRTRKRVRNLAA